MKKYKEKSFEELLAKVEKLELMDDESDRGYIEIISLYEKLTRYIKRDREGKYNNWAEYVQKNMIFNLVHYGTYLKTIYQKNDKLAKEKLLEALSHDSLLPIAHYRLGFLTYKIKDYVEASKYFYQAIETNKICTSPDYKLNHLQNYNAHLYLENSALYIAEFAKENAERIEDKNKLDLVPTYKKSSLYEVIRSNEDYLESRAFTVIRQKSKEMCSKDDCEDYLDERDHIILYFSDDNIKLSYNGMEERLSKEQAEMVRYFMQYSRVIEPISSEKFKDLFVGLNGKEILRNTFNQKISRIRERFSNIGVPTTVISKKDIIGEPRSRYYYDQSFPYIIIHRSDIDFMLVD